jgi:hypothetical protein
MNRLRARRKWFKKGCRQMRQLYMDPCIKFSVPLFGRRERAPAPSQESRFLRLGFAVSAQKNKSESIFTWSWKSGYTFLDGCRKAPSASVESSSDILKHPAGRMRCPGTWSRPPREKDSTTHGTALKISESRWDSHGGGHFGRWGKKKLVLPCDFTIGVYRSTC